MGANPTTSNQSQKLYGTTWNLQILRSKRAEAKSAHDDAGKASDCRVGDLRPDGHDE